MSNIDSVFNKPSHKALIPYVTAGYPDIETTLEIVPLLAELGSDIIEIGIPFSDPLADGVTIQKASHQALQNGITPKACLEMAEKLSNSVDIPLVFMSYYNPVFHYGLEAFCRDCKQAGISGLIIPDLLPEEGFELEAITGEHNLDLVYFLAPTSTSERIKLVAEKARGFIYLVSLTGVTGARDSLPVDLESFVTRVRKSATQPLCVGFGISTPEQAKQVGNIADGVIVGSRLIQIIENESNLKSSISAFIGGLRQALDEISGNSA